MKNYKMCSPAIVLYHHLISADKLNIGERYKINKGIFLTIIKKDTNNNIFAISNTGKHLKKALDEINQFGKIKIEIIKKTDEFTIFTTKPQEFTPIPWDKPLCILDLN